VWRIETTPPQATVIASDPAVLIPDAGGIDHYQHD
jgi:hypothetical protein